MKRNIFSFLAVVSTVFVFSILPDAAAEQSAQGRALVQERCTICHNLNRVERKVGQYKAEAWDDYVIRMQKNGARVTDSEKDVIVKFLSNLQSGEDL